MTVPRPAHKAMLAKALALQLVNIRPRHDGHIGPVEIRGEYHTGPDEGALDAVVLKAGK